MPTSTSIFASIRAMRRPVATADTCPCAARACACHECAPVKKNRVPAGLPPPPPKAPNQPLSHRALGLPLCRPTGSPAHLRPLRHPLKGFHLGGQALVVAAQGVTAASAARLSTGARARGCSVSLRAASAESFRTCHGTDCCCCCSSHWATSPRAWSRVEYSWGGACGGDLGRGGKCVWGGRCSALGRGGRGGGGVHILSPDINDAPPPNPLARLPHMDTHGKPCHVRPVRPLLVPAHDRGQRNEHGHCRRPPALPNPGHPRLHPPAPAHWPVGKHDYWRLPLEEVGTPLHQKGKGEEDADVALHPLGLHG